MGKMQSLADYSDVSSKSTEPIARITEGRPVGRRWNLQLKANDEDKFYKKSETGNTRKADSFDERTQDKRSCGEGVEKRPVFLHFDLFTVPVQNPAAAQKLLKKMRHQNRDDMHSRGRPRAQHGLGFDLNRNSSMMLQTTSVCSFGESTGLFFDCANAFIDFKGNRKVIDLLLKCRVNFLLTCQGKSR
ncbi:hypothetical protein COP1_026313 [Malus domestica]